MFVANPRKPDEIILVLFNNRDKLVAYLHNFHVNKDDDQLNEEKALIIDTLLGLSKPQNSDAPRVSLGQEISIRSEEPVGNNARSPSG